MPILRCFECEAAIAWRGKSLTLRCPNDHGEAVWSGNGWRDYTRHLHVDRHGIVRNDHGIDAHLPEYVGERGRELVAINAAKGR